MIRIMKVATRLLDPARFTNNGINEFQGEQWANSIVAYYMALASVLAPLTALANGRTTLAKLDNVAGLAHLSKRYGLRASSRPRLLCELGEPLVVLGSHR
jgi:hypothetical protein